MNKPTLLRIAGILFVFCAATAIASPAQVFTNFYGFQGPPRDGAGPNAAGLHASDGNFYVTTDGGGDNQNTSFCINTEGCGAIVKITPSGTHTLLYSFCSQPNCSDGANPQSGLVQGSDGNLYGTTQVGGTGTECIYGTCGVVFKITLQGMMTTLYSFCSQSNCSDGANPVDTLVQGSDGNFYGTTFNGGSGCEGGGCGTVFKITPSGTLTTIHRFNSYDGFWPFAGLVQASDGNFYGTTLLGGVDGLNGQGTSLRSPPPERSLCSTVFARNPTARMARLLMVGWYRPATETSTERHTAAAPMATARSSPLSSTGNFASLHSFAGASDGFYPDAALVQATDSNFYGTTFEGGAHGLGTVFKITAAGALTTLHNFSGYPVDGELPTASLVQVGTKLVRHNGKWRDQHKLWDGLPSDPPAPLHHLPKRRVKVSS